MQMPALLQKAGLRKRSKLFRMSRFEKLVVFLLVLFSAFMLLPLVYIFNHAFKPYQELFVYPPTIFARHPSIQNFIELFNTTSDSIIPVSRYLFNSLAVAVLSVFVVTGVSALCAYPLSKHKFPGHKFVFGSIILTLLFAPETVSIPRYLVVSHLGIMNTYWGHILPMVAVPVGVFLMKQFIDQLPNELLESARMDGAREFTVFLRIVIPVILPAVATIGIISFQSAWGNTETSTLFMQDEQMKTFPFFISSLTANMANNVARQGAAAAAALFMFIPNLVIFLVFQSKVIATMAHSGIK
ncbi:carbohydrate ABC transporter permease [Paenibacillus aurantius]|uniref:Carbohydrate ABC transporter permease n=1 Tax=Paenibacillus aurantius TaxID=2918900 RepID=A0AA96LLH8_9BACL|nr:carbohydrate ABC transporter permease [Paenibacillus aurantius]WJH37517.1 carbohydrate ABC transporter permease [Paenibacillus sp. CC-CFT747]WNQ14255.1 carbohydrate ABC transporter permease [Paenibacillus aurantius]